MRTATHAIPLGRHKHKRTHPHKLKQMLRAMLSRATFHPPTSTRRIEDAAKQAIADASAADTAGNADATRNDDNVDDYYYQQQQ